MSQYYSSAPPPDSSPGSPNSGAVRFAGFTMSGKVGGSPPSGPSSSNVNSGGEDEIPSPGIRMTRAANKERSLSADSAAARGRPLGGREGHSHTVKFENQLSPRAVSPPRASSPVPRPMIQNEEDPQWRSVQLYRQAEQEFTTSYPTGGRVSPKPVHKDTTKKSIRTESIMKKIDRTMVTDSTTLVLKQCELRKIPGNLFQLTRLKELILSKNKIQELPPAIGGLYGLVRLDLHGNKISVLPEEIGLLTRLTHFYCDSNKLERLCRGLESLSRLTFVNLADNMLTELPDVLVRAWPQITVINISYNNITHLPEALASLRHIRTLSIESNPLNYPSNVMNRGTGAIINHVRRISSLSRGQTSIGVLEEENHAAGPDPGEVVKQYEDDLLRKQLIIDELKTSLAECKAEAERASGDHEEKLMRVRLQLSSKYTQDLDDYRTKMEYEYDRVRKTQADAQSAIQTENEAKATAMRAALDAVEEKNVQLDSEVAVLKLKLVEEQALREELQSRFDHAQQHWESEIESLQADLAEAHNNKMELLRQLEESAINAASMGARSPRESSRSERGSTASEDVKVMRDHIDHVESQLAEVNSALEEERHALRTKVEEFGAKDAVILAQNERIAHLEEQATKLAVQFDMELLCAMKEVEELQGKIRDMASSAQEKVDAAEAIAKENHATLTRDIMDRKAQSEEMGARLNAFADQLKMEVGSRDASNMQLQKELQEYKSLALEMIEESDRFRSFAEKSNAEIERAAADMLQTEQQKLAAEISTLKDQLRLTGEVSHQKVADLDKALTATREREKGLANELQQTAARLHECEKEKVALEAKAKANEESYKRIRDELDQEKRKVAVERRMSSASEDDTASSRRLWLVQRVASLEKQLSDTNRKLNEARSLPRPSRMSDEKRDDAEALEAFQEELSRLQKKFTEQAAVVTSARKELALEKTRHDVELTEVKVANDDLRLQLELLQSKCMGDKKRLEQRENEFGEYRAANEITIANMESKLKNADEMLEDQRRSIRKLNGELQESKAAAELDKDASSGTTLSDLQVLNAQKESLLNENKRLQDELSEARAAVSRIESRIAELEQQRRQSIAEFEVRIAESDGSNAKQDLKNALGRLKLSEQQRESLAAESQTLNNELQKALNEAREAKRLAMSNDEQVLASNRRVASLESDIRAMEADLDSAKEEALSLRSTFSLERSELQSQVDVLARDKRSLEYDLKSAADNHRNEMEVARGHHDRVERALREEVNSIQQRFSDLSIAADREKSSLLGELQSLRDQYRKQHEQSVKSTLESSQEVQRIAHTSQLVASAVLRLREIIQAKRGGTPNPTSPVGSMPSRYAAGSPSLGTPDMNEALRVVEEVEMLHTQEKAAMADAERRLQQVNETNMHLSRQVEAAASSERSCAARLQEMQKQNAEMSARMRELEQDSFQCGLLKSEVQALKGTISGLENNLHGAREDSQMRSFERDRAYGEVQALKEQLQAQRASQQNLAHMSAMERRSPPPFNVSTPGSTLSSPSPGVPPLTNSYEISLLQSEVDRLRVDLEYKSTEVSRLTKQISEERNMWQQQSDASRRTADEQTAQIARLKEDIKVQSRASSQERTRVGQSNESLDRQLADAHRDCMLAAERIATLESENTKLQLEHGGAKSDIESVTGRCQALLAQVETLSERAITAEETARSADSERVRFELLAKEWERKYSEVLEKTFENQSSSQRLLIENLQKETHEIGALRARCESLQVELETSRSEVDKREKELSQLRMDVSKGMMDRSSISARYDVLMKEHESMIHRMERLRKENADELGRVYSELYEAQHRAEEANREARGRPGSAMSQGRESPMQSAAEERAAHLRREVEQLRLEKHKLEVKLSTVEFEREHIAAKVQHTPPSTASSQQNLRDADKLRRMQEDLDTKDEQVRQLEKRIQEEEESHKNSVVQYEASLSDVRKEVDAMRQLHAKPPKGDGCLDAEKEARAEAEREVDEYREKLAASQKSLQACQRDLMKDRTKLKMLTEQFNKFRASSEGSKRGDADEQVALKNQLEDLTAENSRLRAMVEYSKKVQEEMQAAMDKSVARQQEAVASPRSPSAPYTPVSPKQSPAVPVSPSGRTAHDFRLKQTVEENTELRDVVDGLRRKMEQILTEHGAEKARLDVQIMQLQSEMTHKERSFDKERLELEQALDELREELSAVEYEKSTEIDTKNRLLKEIAALQDQEDAESVKWRKKIAEEAALRGEVEQQLIEEAKKNEKLGWIIKQNQRQYDTDMEALVENVGLERKNTQAAEMEAESKERDLEALQANLDARTSELMSFVAQIKERLVQERDSAIEEMRKSFETRLKQAAEEREQCAQERAMLELEHKACAAVLADVRRASEQLEAQGETVDMLTRVIKSSSEGYAEARRQQDLSIAAVAETKAISNEQALKIQSLEIENTSLKRECEQERNQRLAYETRMGDLRELKMKSTDALGKEILARKDMEKRVEVLLGELNESQAEIRLMKDHSRASLSIDQAALGGDREELMRLRKDVVGLKHEHAQWVTQIEIAMGEMKRRLSLSGDTEAFLRKEKDQLSNEVGHLNARVLHLEGELQKGQDMLDLSASAEIGANDRVRLERERAQVAEDKAHEMQEHVDKLNAEKVRLIAELSQARADTIELGRQLNECKEKLNSMDVTLKNSPNAFRERSTSRAAELQYEEQLQHLKSQHLAEVTAAKQEIATLRGAVSVLQQHAQDNQAGTSSREHTSLKILRDSSITLDSPSFSNPEMLGYSNDWVRSRFEDISKELKEAHTTIAMLHKELMRAGAAKQIGHQSGSVEGMQSKGTSPILHGIDPTTATKQTITTPSLAPLPVPADSSVILQAQVSALKEENLRLTQELVEASRHSVQSPALYPVRPVVEQKWMQGEIEILKQENASLSSQVAQARETTQDLLRNISQGIREAGVSAKLQGGADTSRVLGDVKDLMAVLVNETRSRAEEDSSVRLRNLEMELSASRQKISDLTNSIESMQLEFEARTQRMVARTEYEAVVSQLRLSTDDLERKRQDIAALESQRTALEAQREEMFGAIQQLKAERLDNESQHMRKLTELESELSSVISSERLQHQRLKQRLEELSEDAGHDKSRIKMMGGELEIAHEENATLRSDVARLREEKSQVDEKLWKKEEEANRLQGDVRVAQETIHQLESQVASLRQEQSETRGELSNLQSEVDDLNNQHANLSELCERLEASNRDLQESNEEMREHLVLEENKNLEDSRNAQRNLEVRDVQVQALQNTLDQTLEKFSRQQDVNEFLHKRAEEEEGRCKELSQLATGLQETVAGLEKNVAQLNDEKAEKDKRISELAETKAKLERDVESLRKSCDELQNTVEIERSTNMSTASDLESLHATMDSMLRRERSDYEDIAIGMEGQVKQLLERNAQLKQEVDSLRGELQTARETIVTITSAPAPESSPSINHLAKQLNESKQTCAEQKQLITQLTEDVSRLRSSSSSTSHVVTHPVPEPAMIPLPCDSCSVMSAIIDATCTQLAVLVREEELNTNAWLSVVQRTRALPPHHDDDGMKRFNAQSAYARSKHLMNLLLQRARSGPGGTIPSAEISSVMQHYTATLGSFRRNADIFIRAVLEGLAERRVDGQDALAALNAGAPGANISTMADRLAEEVANFDNRISAGPAHDYQDRMDRAGALLSTFTEEIEGLTLRSVQLKAEFENRVSALWKSATVVRKSGQVMAGELQLLADRLSTHKCPTSQSCGNCAKLLHDASVHEATLKRLSRQLDDAAREFLAGVGVHQRSPHRGAGGQSASTKVWWECGLCAGILGVQPQLG